MNENKNGYEKLLIAFVAGGMVGAGLAILLAPREGGEIRGKLCDLLDALKEKTAVAPAADAPEPPPGIGKRAGLAEEIRLRREQLFGKTDPG